MSWIFVLLAFYKGRNRSIKGLPKGAGGDWKALALEADW
jgi:hypothetical protein